MSSRPSTAARSRCAPAVLNQAWATTTAGLTARITARTLGTVLGQADSLATITLSDGVVVTLGKRLGWVSGPALGHCLNARLPPGRLQRPAGATPRKLYAVRRHGRQRFPAQCQ